MIVFCANRFRGIFVCFLFLKPPTYQTCLWKWVSYCLVHESEEKETRRFVVRWWCHAAAYIFYLIVRKLNLILFIVRANGAGASGGVQSGIVVYNIASFFFIFDCTSQQHTMRYMCGAQT